MVMWRVPINYFFALWTIMNLIVSNILFTFVSKINDFNNKQGIHILQMKVFLMDLSIMTIAFSMFLLAPSNLMPMPRYGNTLLTL